MCARLLSLSMFSVGDSMRCSTHCPAANNDGDRAGLPRPLRGSLPEAILTGLSSDQDGGAGSRRVKSRESPHPQPPREQVLRLPARAQSSLGRGPLLGEGATALLSRL